MLLLRVTSIAAVINHNTFLPAESTLQPEGLLHTRGMAASGFAPIVQYSPLLPPVESDRVSVPVWLVILSDQLGIVALRAVTSPTMPIPSGHI